MTRERVKTLVGYDGSEAAQRALEPAAELAGSSGGIGVIHVSVVPGARAELAQGDREQAERLLARQAPCPGVVVPPGAGEAFAL